MEEIKSTVIAIYPNSTPNLMLWKRLNSYSMTLAIYN
uniref:Uncharacterized protein n=1 Tax=Arundo donax TaxID=35708 RepID=A0A0A9A152_ARUDO